MSVTEPDVATAPPPTGLRALAVVRGWPAARATLRAWRTRPLAVFAPWIAISFAIALILLGLVWLVGASSSADPTRLDLRQLLEVQDSWLRDAWHLFRANMLVLALHAMACLAGFIVHLALTDPVEEEYPRVAALSRGLAIIAVGFVPLATVLSISTQAWVLGSRASTLADQLHLPVPTVLWTTVAHSLPELTAVFLPLAASLYLIIARGRPDQLLAATVASVIVAIPVIAASAVVETRTWPDRLVEARRAHPYLGGMQLGTVLVDPRDARSANATLSAGRQLGDETFDDRATAIAVATRHRKSAAVVLEVAGGYVVHELVALRRPNLCETLSGMRLQARPMSLEELEPLTSAPAGFPDELVAFAGDSKVLDPADFERGDTTESRDRPC